MNTKMYAIRITRNFYDPRTEKSYLTNSFQNEDRDEFRFKAEANATVELLDSQVYHTAHNESGRPEYAVVRVS